MTYEVSSEILTLLDDAGKKGATCGEIIEIMCNVIGSVSCGLADKLGIERAEVLSDLYSITLDGLRKVPKDVPDEES